MQGVIFDIKRFAIHDGPGIRTSLFFKGCPLSCWWCHNPESCATGIQQLDFEFKGSKTLGRNVSSEELLTEVEKDRTFYDESGGGITFTGGEPLMQADFLARTAQLFKKHELHLTLDTTGFSSLSSFKKSIEFMDLILFDMKHMDEAKHFEFTGVGNKPIFKNFEYLVETGKEIHVRYPMMPGLNDEDENIEKMGEYLIGFGSIKKIHLLPYHKIASGKYQRLGLENKMASILEPEEPRVQEVKRKLENYGFQVIIG